MGTPQDFVPADVIREKLDGIQRRRAEIRAEDADLSMQEQVLVGLLEHSRSGKRPVKRAASGVTTKILEFVRAHPNTDTDTVAKGLPAFDSRTVKNNLRNLVKDGKIKRDENEKLSLATKEDAIRIAV